MIITITLTTFVGMASTNITSSASLSSSSSSIIASKAVTHVKKVKLESMSYEFLEKELSPVIQHFRYVLVCLRNLFDMLAHVDQIWMYMCVSVCLV